ncbi:MAG: CCA tRNA nucleotidyltransferase [Alphaproteobacteria bacterium]|nr:CCA tRNA nucleotidyltransferase [Alphaproteobacteria bacterium]MDE2337540.1 CCA tRNA nucleotidyltransferase [Alphaproteobacteria bacterium]
MTAPETRKVMAALNEDGGEARFVGGCVRDALANRPVLDIDIATPLAPEDVIARLKQHKIAYAPIGLKHGTVTAIVDGKPFEITTLRLDVLTFGRHAEVKFTDDWKTDASRRDFTINTIYATADGDLYDPFGGIADLRGGVVRFVGDADKRINEDVLRILRFFRFYAHFGRGMPDAAGVKACAMNAKQVSKLSAERIRQEVLKLLAAENCTSAWLLMVNCGIVTHFLPEATNIEALGRLVNLEKRYECPPFPLRRLAALLEVTPSGLQHVITELKLSNDQAEQLSTMVSPDSKASLQMDERDVKKLVYKFGNGTAQSLLLLAGAREYDPDALKRLYHAAASFHAPAFPLRGEDVLKMGLESGPEVGRLLGWIETWWIGEDFRPDRAACLAKLKASMG